MSEIINMQRNNTMPLVSIITVCYNSVKTLEQTIQSVINQTYSNIEYVIIDGGSTDGTVDIIKKYEDKIAYWISEPDKGIYDAMNKGIIKSTGEIVGILNSDDWYHRNAVSNAVFSFIEKKCDLVHGDIIRVSIIGEMIYLYPPDMNKQNIWHGTIYRHPTCFVKKSVYENFGLYSTNYIIAGDYELLLRFHVANLNFCYNNNIIVYMRIGGISTNKHLGFQEVRNISIKYGYSSVKANLWMHYNILRSGKLSLRGLGLEKLARFKNKVLKYTEFPEPVNMLNSINRNNCNDR